MESGDRHWEDSCGWSIFSLVGREFSAQAKVDGAHSIESGFGFPTAANNLPTEQIYCSTLRFLMAFFLTAWTPVRTL